MNTSTIQSLNDTFRSTFVGGQVMMTAGVNSLPPELLAELLNKVRTFESFDNDNDPHREHDFGSTDVDGEKFFWKIDYYDTAMEFASPNPSDPRVTTRVLTIMRADEY